MDGKFNLMYWGKLKIYFFENCKFTSIQNNVERRIEIVQSNDSFWWNSKRLTITLKIMNKH